MFLLYRNQGQRRFGHASIHPYARGTWEFQFTLEGKCTLLLQERGVTKAERVIGPNLSVSGPENVHGWGGEEDDICNSMIFHFDEADFTLRTIVGLAGLRQLNFSAHEIPALQALYDRCAEARRAIGTTPPEAKKRAGLVEPLIYSIVATELSLFFLKHIPKAELFAMPSFGESKVNEALSWYVANLGASPSIAEVARAVHLSPTHLRRLFHKIRGVSPQTAFTHVQFEQVKWLMRDPQLTLERAGERAGFGSASAFSRAFKAEFGISPKKFRETLRKT